MLGYHYAQNWDNQKVDSLRTRKFVVRNHCIHTSVTLGGGGSQVKMFPSPPPENSSCKTKHNSNGM